MLNYARNISVFLMKVTTSWVCMSQLLRVWKTMEVCVSAQKKKKMAFWPLNSLDKACIALQHGTKKTHNTLMLKCISFCLWQVFWNWVLSVLSQKAEQLSYRAPRTKTNPLLIAHTCMRRGRRLKIGTCWLLSLKGYGWNLDNRSDLYDVLAESGKFVHNLIVLC